MATRKAKSHPFSQVEHLEKARQDERLARALFDLGGPYYDWIVVICFYAAMHYIYSKLPIRGVQATHGDLERIIITNFPRSRLFKKYKSLKDKSENMRYFPYSAKLARNNVKFCSDRFRELDEIKRILKI